MFAEWASSAEKTVYAFEPDEENSRAWKKVLEKTENLSYRLIPKGAENLIRRYKPKLAISVYHKSEDIWELPERILSYCPEYTFYLAVFSIQ